MVLPGHTRQDRELARRDEVFGDTRHNIEVEMCAKRGQTALWIVAQIFVSYGNVLVLGDVHDVVKIVTKTRNEATQHEARVPVGTDAQCGDESFEGYETEEAVVSLVKQSPIGGFLLQE